MKGGRHVSDVMDPSIEEMIPRLHTLDQARELLAVTEPLGERRFEANPGVTFEVQEDWGQVAEGMAGSELTSSYVRLGTGGERMRMTKDALLEAGAKVGIPRKLQERSPASWLEAGLNFWFRGDGGWDGRAFKAFVAGGAQPRLVAFGSGSISPFSNLGILDRVVDGLQAHYRVTAEDIYADYKLTHNLELTSVRLVVPGFVRNIRGPGTADPSDMWSTGVQFRNSQLGLRPTTVDGYLFRWRCTNGMIDTLVSSGKFNRRAGGYEDSDVYDWARAAVDGVLGGLEHSLDGVQDSTAVPVESDVNLVLDDLFRQHRVPGKVGQEIVRNMADTGGALSMYSLMQAVTQVANDTELSPAVTEKLLRLGGHIAHSAEKRCAACRRVMPED